MNDVWRLDNISRTYNPGTPGAVEVLTPPGLYGGGFGAAGSGAGFGLPGSSLEDRAARADVYASPGWRRMQARGCGTGISGGGLAINSPKIRRSRTVAEGASGWNCVPYTLPAFTTPVTGRE